MKNILNFNEFVNEQSYNSMDLKVIDYYENLIKDDKGLGGSRKLTKELTWQLGIMDKNRHRIESFIDDSIYKKFKSSKESDFLYFSYNHRMAYPGNTFLLNKHYFNYAEISTEWPNMHAGNCYSRAIDFDINGIEGILFDFQSEAPRSIDKDTEMHLAFVFKKPK